ncbi:MAG: hypothetical protein IT260_00930 [Saprospiraceae bacterium]|nr:hypothetical protein [Saprospiraceae bacterium]
MKYQMIVAALMLAVVFFRCTPAAEVSSPASFVLDTVQAFSARFRVQIPGNTVAALVRKPAGKNYKADTALVSGDSRLVSGLYFPNTDWEFTLLTRSKTAKDWNASTPIYFPNRFNAEQFDKFDFLGLYDSVTIGTIDILPYHTLLNYLSFGCQSFSSGWETVSPVVETVNRFLPVQSGRFYHGVVDLPGVQQQVVFLFKVTNGQVSLVELDSAACVFEFSRLDATSTPTAWNARGVIVSAEHFDAGRQLHITLPEGATLQVRSCVGCLD